MVKHINGKELEELITSSDKPVVCDFWAAWCGPCRMLAPVFETVAETYGEQAEFVKVDVDEAESESAAVKYGVTSIPNIIVFKDGKPAASHLGFVPAEVLESFVKENL